MDGEISQVQNDIQQIENILRSSPFYECDDSSIITNSFQLDSLEQGLHNLPNPNLTFASVSDLVTLSLYFEDLYHDRESVVSKTLLNSASNTIQNNVEHFSGFVNELQKIHDSGNDKYDGGDIDRDTTSLRADYIVTHINQSMEQLETGIRTLESALNL